MKSYSSSEIIKLLNADGWYLSSVKGSHHYYRHPSKLGKVKVPHPKKDLKPKTGQSPCMVPVELVGNAKRYPSNPQDKKEGV
ncbi:hypothetical protein GCM10025857_12570 [Alicyclobacillus contaminans]|uniref:type II toxin-antitoxin system HicA family toxin n=1 Tax=Alicyclobacillus contaminans TaxID=392016 RepID=UPI000A040825|nr:type II toxin-antitoxin system HicA family toxin [Alicyclobacillus contaminans]GMA49900.1 hypothetical protein GCM10025857_12570 [Alicyclobacillus contaminans]